MPGVKLTADQQAKLDTFTDRVNKIVSDALGWQVLEPEYVKLDADAYTRRSWMAVWPFTICERESDGEEEPGVDAAVGRDGTTAPAGGRAKVQQSTKEFITKLFREPRSRKTEVLPQGAA